MSYQTRARERRLPGQPGDGRAEERYGTEPYVGAPVMEQQRELEPVVRTENPGLESQLDMDVTVLAFAQWVSEMKARQHNSQHQMQAEMSMIRSAITSNHTDLSDFKRHGASIQQQMQSEINEIRESLSNVFMEITAAVRHNATQDQEIKLKIQSLNEQAVRNETAFAQLADAADQSQSKLRNAVGEMQLASERMRDELGALNRQTDGLESAVGERAERISADIDQFTNDLHLQLERRREHLKKMVGDVQLVGEALLNLKTDFEEQRRSAGEGQGRLQASLYAVEQTVRRGEGGGARSLPTTAEVLQPGTRYVTTTQVHHHIQPPARPMPVANMVYR